MTTRNLVCIICPAGCELRLEYSTEGVSSCDGGLCTRGLDYARQEIFHPVRTLTTSVQVVNGELPLVSVRTDRPVPKEQLFELMQVLNEVRLEAPVAVGQVVLEEPLGVKCRVLVTKSVARVGK